MERGKEIKNLQDVENFKELKIISASNHAVQRMSELTKLENISETRLNNYTIDEFNSYKGWH
ncbi:hypothetical protein [Vagococcus vulneris]|uniref:hypothetical protein n=1 Tax=Vagococcus vulneris TaxID=1977869 RepID=UPI00140318E0|nr:hypothetical protein [Vagococcus vulneris]